MKIINVITQTKQGINSIDSFAVHEEQLSEEVMEQAAEFFFEKAVTLKFEGNTKDPSKQDVYRDQITDAFYDNKQTSLQIGNYTLSIIYSYV